LSSIDCNSFGFTSVVVEYCELVGVISLSIIGTIFLFISLSDSFKIFSYLSGNLSLIYSLYSFLSASVIDLAAVDPAYTKSSGINPFFFAILYL
jgi:Flp pilus assembly pilin Flp